MATVNLGKVRVTFGGSFDSTLSYPLLTIVDNPYKVKYISKTNVPINSSLSDTTYWEALSGQFVEQYQGDGTTDPTTRVDGSALKTGDLFFNTTLSQMRVYDGTVWKSAGSTVNGTSQRQTFTATAGQTTFTITGGYEPGFADVYLNGIKLENGVDVDVSSGTDVVLTTGADAGDIVDVVAYGDFKIANTYTKAEVDAKDAGRSSGNKPFDVYDKTQVDAKDALKLDSSVYTAADVLTKVKAVDGAGSDLNADLVDGVQGALLGIGGQGYSWVDETANRVVGTTYINTYGKPIMVALNLISTAATAISLTIDSISIWSDYQSLTNRRISIEGAIIPNGSTYILNITTGTPTLLSWSELK